MDCQRINYRLVIVFTSFAILYSLVSLVNHYCFRTYALDLGLYTNALYDYIHFQWNDSLAFKEVSENLLADHFDIYLMIFSPFSLIFKTYTLLIVQIIAILFGAYGIYKYFSIKNSDSKLPLYAVIQFFLFFGIFSALSFDYHSNVVAAMLVPWFFYFIRVKKQIPALIFLLIIAISKENISLWMAFVCLGLIIEYRKEKKQMLWLGFLFFISLGYFMLITGIVMPALSNKGSYPHFHYSVLGSNSGEAFVYMISHPFQSLQILFTNHTGNSAGDYVKTESHIFIFLSGLFLLLLRPAFLVMLIPIYFQKMFHDNYLMWSIDWHYSIEFAPIITLGAFTFLENREKRKFQTIMSLFIIILTMLVSFRLMDKTYIFTNKSRIRFYQAKHYRNTYDIQPVYKALENIPDEAVVCTQSPYMPHLALRDSIYQLPHIKDAEYIVFNTSEDPYPMNRKNFDTLVNELLNSEKWKVVEKQQGFHILKRMQ
ncbi:MAG: DUF2079 domain-containing protein [Bacteroidota bacterium]